jgi:hypothetical protein
MTSAMSEAPSLHRLSTSPSREDWIGPRAGEVIQAPAMPANLGWRHHKVLSTDFQARGLTPFALAMPWQIALLKETRPAPAVEVPTAVRTVSAGIFAVCAVSLALWRLSGLFYISPLVSVFGCLGAILMFALSLRVEREWRNGA